MSDTEARAQTRAEFRFFQALENHPLLWNCVVHPALLTFSEIPFSWKVSPQIYDLNMEADTGAHTAHVEGERL